MKPFIALAPFLIFALGIKGQTEQAVYGTRLKQLADSFPILKTRLKELLDMEQSLDFKSSKAFSKYQKKYGFRSEYESKEWKRWEQLDAQSDSAWQLARHTYDRIGDLFDSLSTGLYNSAQIIQLIGQPDIKFVIDSAGNVIASKPGINNDSAAYIDRSEHFLMECRPVVHMREGQDDEILARMKKLDKEPKRENVYYYYAIPGQRFKYFILVFTNDIAYTALLYRHLD